MTPTDAHRSELFEYADHYVAARAAISPLYATEIGVPGYDHLLPDYSATARARDAALTSASLARVDAIEPIDEIDRIAKAVMVERLAARHSLEATGEIDRTFSVLSSPVADIRQVFELMATEAREDLDCITERLGAVPAAFESWRGLLAELADAGTLPPRRHVAGVAAQARTHATGTYSAFAERTAGAHGPMRAAAQAAERACGDLATWMDDQLVARATEVEACGPERYARWARNYCGMEIDFDELYEWGWQDLKRIHARMWELAGVIAPGAATLVEVASALDADDSRAVFGTDELLARLMAFTASTVEALDGTHFDIDPRIRRCDARLAPEGSAAAPYYIAPSEDLSRPGTTWFPTLGETRFPWWQHVATWYHESVPGHHLQCAIALIEFERLSRFQRVDAWTSGYGEGWALYAERLMDELGAYTDPGDELGYLVGQGLRAARIVVDLGLHLGYRVPADLGELGGLGDCGGAPWTPEMAVALLDEWTLCAHAMSVSEVDRYLGNPGQAISYKVGEREWLAAREAARARLGDDFSLKAFHSTSLRMGPMGLETFRRELEAWDGS